MKYELIATATFGLEAVVKRELENLNFKITKREDAKITYIGDERAIVRSNLWLRSADRVFIKLLEIPLTEFEDLFQAVKGIEWERFLPIDANFIINASSVKSKLRSVPSIQSVSEKALISRLSEIYNISRFEKTGALYSIRINFLKDRATITLDSSGVGLHKRAYRVKNVSAPLKETLAAGLVQLSFFKPGRIFIDPFCGSGTLPIEAALINKNLAPGLGRKFASEDWGLIDKNLWREERKKAFESIIDPELNPDYKPNIYAFDKDKAAIEATRENAIEAGVEDLLTIKRQDFNTFASTALADIKSAMIVTNPPYGERIGDKKDLEKMYRTIKDFYKRRPYWSLFMITAEKELEKKMDLKANRRRKLYNGRIETTYFQFHGQKA